MRERDLLHAVMTGAAWLGWLCIHQFDSRRSQPGFPDCLCVRDGRVVALEFKTEKGRVRPEQQAWLDALSQVPGVVARVVRPADLDEIIEEVLR